MRFKVIHANLIVLLGLAACGPLPPFLGFLGTDTPTPTDIATSTPTYTFTATYTPTFTSTYTLTPSETPTATFTSTFTPTRTRRPYVPPAGNTNLNGCPATNNGYVSAVIALVNSQRVANGLSALSVNWTLVANSQAWSNHMATNNVLEHSRQNGGENVAGGYDSPGAVMTAWMESQGHRDNILNSSYTQIGAGYAYCKGSQYGHYWTLQFLP